MARRHLPARDGLAPTRRARVERAMRFRFEARGASCRHNCGMEFTRIGSVPELDVEEWRVDVDSVPAKAVPAHVRVTVRDDDEQMVALSLDAANAMRLARLLQEAATTLP